KTFLSLRDLPHDPATLQFGGVVAALLLELAPAPRKLIRIVESGVRHGLIGPSAFDRLDSNTTLLTNSTTPWTCTIGNECDLDQAIARIQVPSTGTLPFIAFKDIAPVDLTAATEIRVEIQDTLESNGDLT